MSEELNIDPESPVTAGNFSLENGKDYGPVVGWQTGSSGAPLSDHRIEAVTAEAMEASASREEKAAKEDQIAELRQTVSSLQKEVEHLTKQLHQHMKRQESPGEENLEALPPELPTREAAAADGEDQQSNESDQEEEIEHRSEAAMWWGDEATSGPEDFNPEETRQYQRLRRIRERLRQSKVKSIEEIKKPAMPVHTLLSKRREMLDRQESLKRGLINCLSALAIANGVGLAIVFVGKVEYTIENKRYERYVKKLEEAKKREAKEAEANNPSHPEMTPLLNPTQ